LNAILDTNVLVSGIFFSGPPRRILEAWNDGAFDLVLSPEILDEYRRVADELHSQYTSIEIRPILDLLVVRSRICLAEPLETQVCTDPDDDKFLACAIAASVQTIVSGDKSLLRVSGYQGIEVVRPRYFVENYL
jgi:putative PIN family toxin of toxin-antitoxin system